jgi:uncharacterized membrane protein
MIRNYARPLILTLAGVALAASVSSLYVHYQMLMDPLYSSFCDISETVSCQTVYASEYGTVFGIPVAAGGAIWSALVLLLGFTGLKARRSEQTQVVLGYIFLLSLVGVAVVLYYAYASFMVLGVTCPLCVAVYVSVAGIFLVASSASATPVASLFSRLSGDLQAVRRDSVGQTVALVWIAASVALVILFPREQLGAATEVAVGGAAVPALTETLTNAQRDQLDLWIDTQVREDIPVPAEAEGAAVVIQKFNDYICPSCRQTYVEYLPVVAKWRESHPEDVAFVMRDFPLEAECNVGAVHLSACEAAVAVRMAKEVGRGEEMEAWLFDNQPTMTPDRVKEGVELIAQVADYDERYQEVLADVRLDAQLGLRLNVESTPTFFVNGIRIVGGLRPSYLDALIAELLERSEATAPVAAAEPTAD